jgi:hypothetical protein
VAKYTGEGNRGAGTRGEINPKSKIQTKNLRN